MSVGRVIASIGPLAAIALLPLRLIDEILSSAARDNARAAVEDARRRAQARAALDKLLAA